MSRHNNNKTIRREKKEEEEAKGDNNVGIFIDLLGFRFVGFK